MQLDNVWSIAPTEEITLLTSDDNEAAIAVQNLGPSTDIRIKFAGAGSAIEEPETGTVYLRKGSELTVWNMSADQHSVGKWGFEPA